MTDRRSFIGMAGLAAGAGLLGELAAAPARAATKAPAKEWFHISLAEWSFNRTLRAANAKMTNLDFPIVARRDFNIDVIEYVNQFWMDKAEDKTYLAELKKRCDDNGVKSGLIMCDREGSLGDPDPAERTKAITNHYKWVTAAAYLGCHSIRVNAYSKGTAGETLDYSVDGLRRLAEFAAQNGNLNVIVENHGYAANAGSYSSHGKWLALAIDQVGLPNVGTLPDFGNWYIPSGKQYDCYQGVSEVIQYAKGVSAKSHAFDAAGNETTIDYRRMLTIVRDGGFRGNVGIEFEGRGGMEDADGVKATKRLLEKLRAELAPAA